MTMKKILLPLLLGSATFDASAQNNPDKWDISKIYVSKLPSAATNTDLTYEKDIRPIFEASCFRCHGAQGRPRGGLRVDSLDAVIKGGEAGKVVVAGSGDKSLLVMAVSQLDGGTTMPPKPRQRRGGPGGPGGPNGGPPGAMGGTNAVPAAGGAPNDAPPGGPGGGPPGGGSGRRTRQEWPASQAFDPGSGCPRPRLDQSGREVGSRQGRLI